MNFEQARSNMVEQQLRPWEVLDPRVLDAIMRTPREAYVPEEYRDLAFTDAQIPLGRGEVMMRPIVEGRMLQALDVAETDTVLEIGTGSGYITACLALLARHVYSVDIAGEFVEQAGRKLADFDIANVTLQTGDAARGWDRGAPEYDAIAVTGALAAVPDAYKRALSAGGRLFVIIGRPDRPIMEALLITRVGADQWMQESLFDTYIPFLANAPLPESFEF